MLEAHGPDYNGRFKIGTKRIQDCDPNLDVPPFVIAHAVPYGKH